MKFSYTFIFILALQSVAFGQQSDANTAAINTYFQLENDVSGVDVSEKQMPSPSSNVNIVQAGVENDVYINSLQKGDSQDVSQLGDKNNYEFYNYYSTENSNIQVNQEGNLNSVQVFGENSLMKKAVINQKSNYQTIVVKNYTR